MLLLGTHDSVQICGSDSCPASAQAKTHRKTVYVPGGLGPCNGSGRTRLLCSSDIYGARELLSQKQHDCGRPRVECGSYT